MWGPRFRVQGSDRSETGLKKTRTDAIRQTNDRSRRYQKHYDTYLCRAMSFGTRGKVYFCNYGDINYSDEIFPLKFAARLLSPPPTRRGVICAIFFFTYILFYTLFEFSPWFLKRGHLVKEKRRNTFVQKILRHNITRFTYEWPAIFERIVRTVRFS